MGVGLGRGKVQCGELWVPAPGFDGKPRGMLAWRWHPGPKAVYGCSFPLSERSCIHRGVIYVINVIGVMVGIAVLEGADFLEGFGVGQASGRETVARHAEV